MRFELLLITFLIMSCTHKKETTEQLRNDTFPNDMVKKNDLKQIKFREFRDTTINGISLKFSELTDDSYDSLKSFDIQTIIPLQPALNIITEKDSCFTIKLGNGKTDSLCSKKDGDNYQKYSIRGFWKEKNLLFTSYHDWEGGNDFFINLTNGDYYNLTPDYELSPNGRFILLYVDIDGFALLSSQLILARLDNDGITTVLDITLGSHIVYEVSWISEELCLISVGTLDEATFTIENPKKYKLRIN